ncbi:hypothetical protein B0H14DRAFT_2586496 [Mycena olivaceomarginata]|nr:hypothetical protein B0H14DRAFT_2586496 [Mycena olivaceomarginata]
MSGNSMHVQIISAHNAPPFIVATFPDEWGLFSIPYLPGLSPAQLTTLLATLVLEDHVRSLTFGPQCGIRLPILRDFILRDSSVRNLNLHSGAIDFASLTVALELPAHPGRITTLCTAAAYTPYILPLEPQLAHLAIYSAEDDAQLARAFATIASLPIDTPLRIFTISLFSPVSFQPTLPWRMDPMKGTPNVFPTTASSKTKNDARYLKKPMGFFLSASKLETLSLTAQVEGGHTNT